MKNHHKQEGIYSIDFYAYTSKMREWNPAFKMLSAFVTLLFCVAASNSYISIFVILTMSFITIYLGKLNIMHYLSLFTIPVGFMVMGGIAIAIEVGTVPYEPYFIDFHLFYLYTSKESILKSLQIILKAMGAVSAMYMVVLSTPASEVISVLQKMHMPPLIVELMNMIYRFIFIILDVYCKMKISAQSRLGYCDFKTACHSFGYILGNLLLISFKKANSYYDALVSRCYDGNLIFLEEKKSIKTIHKIGAVFYIISLAVIWIKTK